MKKVAMPICIQQKASKRSQDVVRRMIANSLGYEQVELQDFIGREMIHFSKYDCDRSIPNRVDGLKTSLRKILLQIKRKLTNKIKVAQFSGSVSRSVATITVKAV